MSTEVSQDAFDALAEAFARNVGLFAAQTWVDLTTGVLKQHGHQAAALLTPGESVEWAVTGVMHRYGKVWSPAILMITPFRSLIMARRGIVRPKTDADALYRGPETLLEITERMMPGTSSSYWTLELASESGPFLFAIPEFSQSRRLAELTGAFVAGRASYTAAARQILVDGAPLVGDSTVPNPFDAAQADLTPTAVSPAAPLIPRMREPDQALPPPDWYDDPLSASGLRYWDGIGWTQHTAS